MPLCAACGHEIAEEFKFCPECGSPAIVDAAPHAQRKTVTALFCDVTGSTSLGESVDPEALRALLARYFERMSEIVESHGGTVEKFIGDAVMAVFGVPVVHEDDALRAVRAAIGMRDAFPGLGVEARIGVNTGEVVTGTEERLATGDAVNVAARLEQAAQPGEVLVGEPTLALVQDAVEVEKLEPLELKGKSEPVSAYRLLSVSEEAPVRHLEAPLVGREREQRLLSDAWERASSERSCHLFTLLGTAGVGKSRLAAEFLRALDATVVRGRCLSYGEGIRPLVEVLKQFDAMPSDELAAAALTAVLGESEEPTSPEEIAWAFRKLLEEQAHERPLVCLFDDLHWGEETFLKLVEHVADLSRGAPILLLCLARPELLDRRPSWAGGKLNATTLLLEPLSPSEAEALLDGLLAGAEIEGSLRGRIREAAEGNPLFVEEIVAMVRESGNGEVVVPPTIQALLAARLDQLPTPEREVLECGAIEGKVFHRGALQALAPDSRVDTHLLALIRKELIRPDRPLLSGDEAYVFRHLLIRDAAYEALPKAIRAEFHERFANWLEPRAANLVEADEIIGYHLEQAVRYRMELGRGDAGTEELAARASTLLARAGRRAREADMRAGANLLERSLALQSPESHDPSVELDLAWLLISIGKREDARALTNAIVERAVAVGDRPGELHARFFIAASEIDFEGGLEPALELSNEAQPVFEAAEDDIGLARLWQLRADVEWVRGHCRCTGRCPEAGARIRPPLGGYAASEGLDHGHELGRLLRTYTGRGGPPPLRGRSVA
jgi:class 3 adenylate cyclase